MHDGEQLDGSALVQAASNLDNVELASPSLRRSKLLYLYSGPMKDNGGFADFCKQRSLECVCIDKEIDDKHDLTDQQVWDELADVYPDMQGFLMSPPCSTFTAARNESDGGPRPLRTATGSERYGRRDATPQEKTRVREGTLLAKRAHETALHAEKSNKPWVLEQPHWRTGRTSMFTLDEFQELLEYDDVKIYTLAQCRFGAQAEKLTDLLSNRDLSDLELKCNHPAVWWRIPWSGEWIHASHPPLRGRQLAVRAEDWNESMLRSYEPSGPYVTRAFAAYPPGLNQALADKFATWLEQPQQPATSGGNQDTRVDHLDNDDPSVDTKLRMPLKLRPQQQDKKLDSDLWSLRNIHRSMTGRSKLLGVQIGNLIERELDLHADVEAAIVDNFGKTAEDVVMPHEWLDNLRKQVADLLQRNRLENMPDTCDVSPIQQEDYKTVVRGKLLEYWAMSTKDPAAFAAKWLYQGTPAGLEMNIELNGIC